MKAQVLLRAMGEGLASGMRQLEVPSLYVDQWSTSWALDVADVVEEGMDAKQLSACVWQSLNLAQELVRIYGKS